MSRLSIAASFAQSPRLARNGALRLFSRLSSNPRRPRKTFQPLALAVSATEFMMASTSGLFRLAVRMTIPVNGKTNRFTAVGDLCRDTSLTNLDAGNPEIWFCRLKSLREM
ncbi:hypothetical protein AVEN_57612-1 [Araneus ventricosus]|uniref:Uncharacterized protein n=1 Tax=Araneus ventricosus TaxID=182803 RepID=A0A4Y2LSV8_ARAVE|nr:hypothetical protein AVEN_57612-1 [Araneus ventricosus]